MKTIPQPAVITPSVIVLGRAILIIATSVFVGWKLPFIQNDQQALIAITVLAGLKIVNAVTHYLLSRA